MTTDERIDRLTGVVEALATAHASSIDGLIKAAEGQQNQIDAHDAQLEALIGIAETQARKNEDLDRRLESLRVFIHETTANLEKQWQAYLRTLPSQ